MILTALVARLVVAVSNRTVVHGVDLARCLVVPRLVTCHEPLPNLNKKLLRLWIVLDTHPVTKDGYLIVFDEQNHESGLAVWGRDGETPVVVSYYGGFLATLAGM